MLSDSGLNVLTQAIENKAKDVSIDPSVLPHDPYHFNVGPTLSHGSSTGRFAVFASLLRVSLFARCALVSAISSFDSPSVVIPRSPGGAKEDI